MITRFHYDLAALGIFSATFLIGTAAFQIPAGVISAKRGPKYACTSGLAIIAAASLASALSGEFYFQIAARLATGVGAALFYAPALTIASGALGGKRSGLAIGIYNSSFNLGAGLALFFFTPLSALFEWWWPFAITAALTLCSLIENLYAFEGINKREKTAIDLSQVRTALTSRNVWLAIVATLGAFGAFYVVSQFIVVYAETQLGYSPTLAGTISSLPSVGAIVGSPIAGLLSDRFRRRRLLILTSAVGASVSISLFSLNSPYAAWVAAFFSGFFVLGGSTIALAYASQLRNIGAQYVPIALGLMNAAGIFAGSVSTFVFPGLVFMNGYALAWILVSIPAIILGPLIYLASEEKRQKSEQEAK